MYRMTAVYMRLNLAYLIALETAWYPELQPCLAGNSHETCQTRRVCLVKHVNSQELHLMLLLAQLQADVRERLQQQLK